MSSAGPPDALMRRIEQLAATAPSDEAEPAVVQLVETLRAETAAVRSALESLVGQVETRDAALRTDLTATLRVDRERAARDREATTELALSVRAALEGLATAMAPEGERAARLRATLESGLDEVRAQVTTELAGARTELAAAIAAQVAAQTNAQAAALGPRVEVLAAAVDATDASLRELRTDLLMTVADLRDRVVSTTVDTTETLREEVLERLGAVLVELSRSTGATTGAGHRLEALTAASEEVRRTLAALAGDAQASLQSLDTQVETQLSAVRTGFDARADELAGTLARGLLDLAEEVDVAATTARDTSSRVSVLAEQAEVQRAEVEGLLRGLHAEVSDAGRGLREDLLTRTSELLAGLGQRLDHLEARVSGVDASLVGSAGAAEGVAAALEDLTATTERLDEAVAAFRTEWPTRTYEVVQGARAVAEAVVLDVRSEVASSLDQVRAALSGVARSVDQARTGLDDGTDRLARAGSVLVAYLEQRDRLLEAERDRVLHDVLDAFAAGLSARERSALAGRVTDVVARRRDARDAERYRNAVGQPVSPTVGLPDQVRTLAVPTAEHPPPAVVAAPPGPPREEPDAPRPDRPEPDLHVPDLAAPDPDDAGPPSAPPAQPLAPPPSAPPRPAAPAAVLRSSAAAGRPPALRRAADSATVVPGPGRSEPVRSAPVRRPARTLAAPGRGRLEVMPTAPPVDLALEAASRPVDRPAED